MFAVPIPNPENPITAHCVATPARVSPIRSKRLAHRRRAMVDAVTRSLELAEEVRVLARMLRRPTGSIIPVWTSVEIAMIASAANENRSEWKLVLGDWFLELALD